MTTNDNLARLLGGPGPVLLDFDGPICGVFAGHPAPKVAAHLVQLLDDITPSVPSQVRDESDPLELLRWADTLGEQGVTRQVEDALCAEEVRAVESASPTPFAREVIVAARQVGKPVAIVSNNSAGAVLAYLRRQRLASHISPVIGRAYAYPAKMKPNPAPILKAVETLGAEPGDCVLIGDSLSDITGARAAGVPVIGYANKPKKGGLFSDADAVVSSMGSLAAVLVELLDQ